MVERTESTEVRRGPLPVDGSRKEETDSAGADAGPPGVHHASSASSWYRRSNSAGSVNRNRSLTG